MMDINISDVNKVLEQDQNVVIDVRETSELEETGYLPGAIHQPMSNFDLDELALDKDKDYYLVCKSGGRSKRVQEYMQENGYKAHNVEGGMSQYEGQREYL